MKGLYIAAIDLNKEEYFGVYKKIQGQLKAFNLLGAKMDSAFIKDLKIIKNGNIIDKALVKPWYIGFHKLLLQELKKSSLNYDFIYIRFSRNDIYFLKLIKYLSRNNIKIIVEIPTYPYNEEFDYSIKQNIYRIIDKYVTNKMHKYVYRIATTNSIDEIFGVKTIQIRNGVDTESIKVVDGTSDKDKINLVGIANLSKWHGYDRVINGIAEYYKENKTKPEVNFYIVGEGNEKVNLINLTNKLKVNKYIHFVGAKRGNDLDKIVNDMHIGVSSLALFRAGGGHDPIKTKEFIAQGLPVIVGYDDKLIDMTLPYILKVPSSEEAINIDEIIKKFNSIQETSQEIRKYAEKNLSWKSQMNKVIALFK